jgi:hypothetical protein
LYRQAFKKKVTIMQKRIYVLFILLGCLACNTTSEKKSDSSDEPATTDIEFDKTKWATKDDADYPYRNQMLKDLLDNQKLKGLKRDSVLDLLGEPDRTDSSYLFYLIEQKRLKFIPLHTKTMVIKLSQDSTVNWVKIHE